MTKRIEPSAQGENRHFPPLGSAINVLLVSPRFAPSFWSMSGLLELVPQDALQPPLGLITVAALCPGSWTMRLVDLSFDALTDADLLWADLVMVSGMRVQHDDMRETLLRARALGKRTMVGGPHASSQPELLLDLADHVVVGEPDEVFGSIADDLERGSARPLYVVEDKPDISRTPIPRFDLLRMERYLMLSVQFARGCPFQCEFCDIITIYGRKPRTKTSDQLLRELDALLALGWRNRIFIVDDNFVGNRKRALELVQRLQEWQGQHGTPFTFKTEASLDLAQHPVLIDAMVKANFWSVFVGIETPSREALAETRKLQNLRQDPLDAVKLIQHGGLWVSAGFIVGFDSDTADIFDRQIAFIERADIAFAIAGFLVALPTTPLYERMRNEGRLIEGVPINRFRSPNFRTILPLPALLRGGISILSGIYEPSAFFDRAFRCVAAWNVRDFQRAPSQPRSYVRSVLVQSVVRQGLRSSYRRAYWRFLFRIIWHWRSNPQKFWLAFSLLLSGHHFIGFAREVTAELSEELRQLGDEPSPVAAKAPAQAA
ncbi:B12-binding domain-containing radical SAM protein [Bradyrhizobium sp.]|jgi:radical SAM superfamily enzyme YgiQ (UPF0313 family)|uniref:B12-binding domain-containing radical SAM protein n=1 Tax=Bradyrhizobium sp. TaxID=376 RepID=UPI003C14D67A